MDSQRDEKLNITINGRETNEKQTNMYEKYVINMNEEFKKENEDLKKQINELESNIDDLENDVEKEESKRIYMKGLMHNLNEIKKKSEKNSFLYDKMYDEFFEYFEDYKHLVLKLDTYLNIKNLWQIVIIFAINPIILNLIIYYRPISLYLTIAIIYNITIFLGLCLFSDTIYNDTLLNKFKQYKEFENKYKAYLVEIKKNKNEVKEIEKAIKDIDKIIDDC